jgi:Kinesin motor domain
MKLLKLGEYHRHYAETRMNHQSSRSHTLFRLHVESVATSISEVDGGAGTNIIKESVLVSCSLEVTIM